MRHTRSRQGRGTGNSAGKNEGEDRMTPGGSPRAATKQEAGTAVEGSAPTRGALDERAASALECPDKQGVPPVPADAKIKSLSHGAL